MERRGLEGQSDGKEGTGGVERWEGGDWRGRAMERRGLEG